MLGPLPDQLPLRPAGGGLQHAGVTPPTPEHLLCTCSICLSARGTRRRFFARSPPVVLAAVAST
eukprot:7815957-Pyramimonas_sp.AAC.1